MIKNIVFDIGNVLTDFNIKEFLLSKGFEPSMIKRILKATIMTPYWEQFERDEIDEEEAIQLFASRDPEIEDDISHAFMNIRGMLTMRDFAIDWIESLKNAGYNVYYLSNYSKKAYYECSDSLEFIDYTDGGYLSFQIHLTKPDPEMYQRFMENFCLDPLECVYIDDTIDNVEMVRALGMEAIQFESYEDTVKQLQELGVVY